jgi:hypothetical protein
METDPIFNPRGDDIAPSFTPIPMQRRRHDGWTPERQLAFVRMLSVTGQVSEACRAVGMSRKSAYKLLDRKGSESFAAAWASALMSGQQRMVDQMMERAIRGVTKIIVKRGGVVEIGHGPDGRLMAGFLKAPRSGEDRFSGRSASKGDIR